MRENFIGKAYKYDDFNNVTLAYDDVNVWPLWHVKQCRLSSLVTCVLATAMYKPQAAFTHFHRDQWHVNQCCLPCLQWCAVCQTIAGWLSVRAWEGESSTLKPVNCVPLAKYCNVVTVCRAYKGKSSTIKLGVMLSTVCLLQKKYWLQSVNHNRKKARS